MVSPAQVFSNQVQPAVQGYVKTDSSGWLRVKLSGGQIISLPQYLKISFLKRQNRRDYFVIKEGVHKGKRASVSQRGESTSWLAKTPLGYDPAVKLVFNKTTKVLTTPIGDLAAKTDTSNPIPNGTHPIQIPDFPHSLGASYLGSATKALTWFYLGIGEAVSGDNDRYLHPGRVSAGCVTVTDVGKWDNLYNVLIKARANTVNVGSIEVKS